MPQLDFSLDDLYKFLKEPGENSYFSEKPPVYSKSQRPDFNELESENGDWYYRDSYIGHSRSRGMDLIRYKGKVVWCSSYGGGIVEGKENLIGECFGFLKKSVPIVEPKFQSVRGPSYFKEDDWEYKYKQDGDLTEFTGREEIYFKGELIFYHNVIGGLVI